MQLLQGPASVGAHLQSHGTREVLPQRLKGQLTTCQLQMSVGQ